MLTRRELLAGAALAPAAARPRPNILLLFPDQLRFDWLGLNPSVPIRTPNLDALARRGTRFTRVVTPSPLCAPARACLASGRDYSRARVPSNRADYPLDLPTYYQMLRKSGYHVTVCGKVDLHKATEDWGLDGKRRLKEWGFSDGIDNAGKNDAIRSGGVAPKDPYMAYLHKRGLAAAHVADFKKRSSYAATFPTPLPDEAYCDNWLANNGIELLRATPKGKPWHLTVNFTGPHNPMDITRSMEKRCRGRAFPQPNGNTEFPPETHVAIRQNYAAMVENIDRWVGIYVDELRKRGELENTVIAFSSDHGEMLGDHNRWAKSVPWQPSIGVPLILAGPGVKNAVSDALVSTMDLAATFLDFANLAVPKNMDSRSLRPVLDGRAHKHRDSLRSGLNDWRVAWDGRYKLVRGDGPEMQLFDMEADPLENRNLAAKMPREVARLQELL